MAESESQQGGAGSVNLRSLLEEMIERDASDLHITAGERPKIRIDGDITSSKVEHQLSPASACVFGSDGESKEAV
jgi:twitching motility protein PilT